MESGSGLRWSLPVILKISTVLPGLWTNQTCTHGRNYGFTDWACLGKAWATRRSPSPLTNILHSLQNHSIAKVPWSRTRFLWKLLQRGRKFTHVTGGCLSWRWELVFGDGPRLSFWGAPVSAFPKCRWHFYFVCFLLRDLLRFIASSGWSAGWPNWAWTSRSWLLHGGECFHCRQFSHSGLPPVPGGSWWFRACSFRWRLQGGCCWCWLLCWAIYWLGY